MANQAHVDLIVDRVTELGHVSADTPRGLMSKLGIGIKSHQNPDGVMSVNQFSKALWAAVHGRKTVRYHAGMPRERGTGEGKIMLSLRRS